MPGVITTGNFPKAMWPGINAFFGMQYNEHKEQWPHLFEKHDSTQAWEEDVMGTGFGLAPIKAQGAPVIYDSESQGYVARYTHVVYALGFVVSWEEMLNNLYESVGKRRAQRLAFSMRQTKEWNCANMYNRGFNAGYVGGDGVSFLSASHPSSSGLQSNLLSPAADLSEASIEDLMIQVGTALNDKGHPVGIQAQKLIVHWQNWYEARRVFNSVLQSGTANNDVNVLLMEGALPGGIHPNNYLTDSDSYFMRTNVPHGAKLFQRLPTVFEEDFDIDTRNQKYAAFDYYSVSWSDWRTVYGSAGA